MNPLTDLAKLLTEPRSYWLNILKKYLVENKYVSVQCFPSKEEKQKMAREEKERVEAQIKALGEKGLQEKGEILRKAIEFNEREPPVDMLTCVPIPSLESIKFHNVTRYKTDIEEDSRINLSRTPVFTYFDHVKTGFVYVSDYYF